MYLHVSFSKSHILFWKCRWTIKILKKKCVESWKLRQSRKIGSQNLRSNNSVPKDHNPEISERQTLKFQNLSYFSNFTIQLFAQFAQVVSVSNFYLGFRDVVVAFNFWHFFELCISTEAQRTPRHEDDPWNPLSLNRTTRPCSSSLPVQSLGRESAPLARAPWRHFARQRSARRSAILCEWALSAFTGYLCCGTRGQWRR